MFNGTQLLLPYSPVIVPRIQGEGVTSRDVIGSRSWRQGETSRLIFGRQSPMRFNCPSWLNSTIASGAK
jgi:hypothetical protein